MSASDIAVVTSSNGNVKIDAWTGMVLEIEVFEDCEMHDIIHFDLDEYYQHYPAESREDVRQYDILDLGYTYVSETGAVCYCEPEHEWRAEIAKDLHPHTPDPALRLFSR